MEKEIAFIHFTYILLHALRNKLPTANKHLPAENSIAGQNYDRKIYRKMLGLRQNRLAKSLVNFQLTQYELIVSNTIVLSARGRPLSTRWELVTHVDTNS